MVWDEALFAAGARVLLQVLQQESVQQMKEGELRSSNSSSPLLWSFEKGCLETRLTTHLQHHVNRRSNDCADHPVVNDDDDTTQDDAFDVSKSCNDESGAVEEYDNCDEDSTGAAAAQLWDDADVVVPVPDSLERHADKRYHRNLNQRDWHLSVVLSPVWNVPVLYFVVYHSVEKDHDGGTSMTPCTRQEVLATLQRSKTSSSVQNNDISNDIDNADSDDSWDFMSYDQHPVTGLPMLMVHPCRTRDCLQVMRKSSPSFLNKSPNGETTSSSSSSNFNCSDATLPSSVVMAQELWSWLAMILPSIGLSSVITPSLYQHVSNQLQELFVKLDKSQAEAKATA